MDLWDVVRLMLRRWLVAVPMLLVTLVGTVWAGMHVKPDYTAEGNVSLLPPSVQPATVTGKAQTVNPWDTGTLTGAVVVRLRSKSLHDSLAAEGFSSVFEADRDLQYPSIITIKVTAASEAAAQNTVKRLLQVIREEVTEQQKRYNLKPGEEITTIVVDDGSNVEPATGKVKRALIVVFGIGAILTIAVTVCIDALLRWRARQRLTRQQRLAAKALRLPGLVQSSVARPAGGPVPGGGPLPATGQFSNGQSAGNGQSGGGSRPSPSARTSRAASLKNGTTDGSADGTGEETRPIGVSIKYRQPNRSVSAPPAMDEPVTENAGSGTAASDADELTDLSPEATQRIDTRLEPVADDATIILPLSNAPWATNRKSPNGDRGAEVKPR